MCRLKRYQKISICAIAALASLLLAAYLGKRASRAPQAPKDAHYERFHAEGVALTKYAGEDLAYSLGIREIYQRKRVSKLFTYENLKELYLKGVSLDIRYARGGGIPLDEIGKSFSAIESNLTPAREAAESGSLDVDMSLISRVVMESLEIRLRAGKGPGVSLTAKEGAINSLFDQLVLYDDVVLTAGGRVLRAKKAVWSAKDNGLYYPEGYADGGVTYAGRAFFRLSDDGTLVKAENPPEVDYADLLEKKEAGMYAAMARDLSVMEKLALGLPVSMEDLMKQGKAARRGD